ncbi:helix-turn-helix domain-containing protein [Flavobacteriaceae bacterium Ap0902]|nr:helix-turn-helix domain-containing protein [Flavobacteriaceae bacterium Ap0902]
MKIIYFCHKLTSLMSATFGEYIRRLRTKNKMTLTNLAAKLNLDSANLSKIENNKRDFDEKRLSLLARVFDLDLTELQDEYIADQIGKKIFEYNCSKQILKVAEEKAEYRRKIKERIL